MSKSTESPAPKSPRTTRTKKSDTETKPVDAVATKASAKKAASTTAESAAKTKTTKTSKVATSAAVASNEAADKPKSSTRRKPVTTQLPSQELVNSMIEEAAYYLAEKRHFAPGFEQQDWLAAKEQIMQQLQKAASPIK